MNDVKEHFRNLYIPWYKKVWWDLEFYLELMVAKTCPYYGQYIDLFWLHYHGFYPVAIVDGYLFERVFLFDKSDVATKAYETCEVNNHKAIGFYYEVEEFKQKIKEHERFNFEDLNIWWIYQNDADKDHQQN